MAGGNVPANLAPIFVAAGKANNIPPNVLAGIASVETNLGANTSRSSAGAIGLMQFLPSTAQSIGVNPNDPSSAIFGAAKLLNQYGYQSNPTRAIGAYNGGPGNPQYGYAQQVLSEANRLKGELAGVGPGAMPAAGGGTTTLPPVTTGTLPGLSVQVPTFDQAGFDKAQKGYVLGSFLQHQSNPYDVPGTPKIDTGPSALGALYQAGVLSSKPPNPQDFQGSRTVQIAHNQLQQLAGTTILTPHPASVPGYKGYVNPISGFNVGRTDMGVDASARPGTPIRAIGDSQVVAIRPNWYAGQPYIQLKLLNGPKAGSYYYVAEQITPNVHPGQVLHTGDPIGTYAPSGTGIEIGWGSAGWQTLAQAQGNTGDASHGNAPAGVDFRNFLGSLGAR